jgi:chromosome partitioning protein
MEANMSKPIVIAIMCHKGGTAKTSTISGLADAIVQTHPDKKVLIVDTDEQSNQKTIFGIKLHEAEGGTASCLLNGISPDKILITVRPNIAVILSGGRAVRDFEKIIANQPDAEILMRKHFSSLTGFDFILIDTPPALSLISSNVVLYSDYILIPCSPEMLALVGVKNTLAFLEDMEKHYKHKHKHFPKVLGVVPTLHDKRRLLDLGIIDDLERMQQHDMLKGGIVFAPIANDIKVKTSQVKRRLLSEFAPQSKAAEGYQQLAREIIKMTTEKSKLPTPSKPRSIPKKSELDVTI